MKGEIIAKRIVVALLCFAALLSFLAIVKPEWAVAWSIKYYDWNLKLFGLEGYVRQTPAAVGISRMWNIVVLCVIIVSLKSILSNKSRA